MSGMTPTKRSLLRDRLAGVEFRNQLRQAGRAVAFYRPV